MYLIVNYLQAVVEVWLRNIIIAMLHGFRRYSYRYMVTSISLVKCYKNIYGSRLELMNDLLNTDLC